MKIKKALACILAVAMVISLMPAMAFAASTNTVVKTYTVASDDDMPVVAIDLKVTKADGIAAGTEEKIKISLENAEWAVDSVAEDNLYGNILNVQAAFNSGLACTAAGMYMHDITTNKAISAVVNSVDDDYATLTVSSSAIIAKDATVRLYLALHSGTEDGEVKVTIDAADSDFSGGTYTVATVGNSNTTAEVTGSVKTYPRQSVTGAAIEISETAVNSVTGNQVLKLTLPAGFKWNAIKVSGDMLNGGAVVYSGGHSLSAVTPGAVGTLSYFDGRTAYILVSVKDLPTVRQDLVIEPNFEITKDASMGDVTVSVAGYQASGDKISSANGLVVAKYGDEVVTVSTDESDIPTIVAGYVKDSDEDVFAVEVTVKEGTKGSLSAGRYIDFDFNDEVSIVTTEAIKYYVGTGSSSYDKASSLDSDAPSLLDRETDSTKDCSEFSLTVPSSGGTSLTGWNFGKANTLTLYIPVTAKANYTGDVQLNVSGSKAGIEETDLVVGKVIAPISVETTVTDVINGAQGQALADIKITENVPGYIEKDDNITLTLDTLNISGGYAFKTSGVKAAVTAGDLELKSGDIVKNQAADIVLTVKNPSVVASTIEVTGVVINMARNLPSGEYALKASLSNIENAMYDNSNYKRTVTKSAYVNITTAAENTTANDSFTATFVIGEASYTNNGESNTMDAAAYIDSHNRTMVPIRYVANACGISENDITWNQATQTATINGSNTVVTIKMGSNKIQTSAGEITMDTVAVNNNGRIYVPVRFIANALGANVAWDANTRTVTLTK